MEPFHLLRDHSTSSCLRYQPDPFQVGIDNFVPIGLVLLQCRPCRRNTSVVNYNLNWTESCFSSVQRGFDARCDGDVHHHALGLALRSGDVIDSFGQSFRATRANGHACPPR